MDLDNEVEVLITNLYDEQAFPAKCFKHLYHLRWGIEENYKRLKQWLEVENFSGKTALAVQQDFYAKILATNLTQFLCTQAQKIVRQNTKKTKLDYQVNFAQGVSKAKHKMVRLIFLAKRLSKSVTDQIRQLVESLSLSPTAVRENRSFCRNIKSKKSHFFYQEYKRAL